MPRLRPVWAGAAGCNDTSTLANLLIRPPRQRAPMILTITYQEQQLYRNPMFCHHGALALSGGIGPEVTMPGKGCQILSRLQAFCQTRRPL